ncbi:MULTISPECIES: nitric oxide reductase activation protein NorD [Nocardia]|uniref:nitric oxide reductase activation protein NorD n=1 Tax=Nocardia TaxID=1817 RepID=UPI000D688678|nr:MULTISPECIES: VWA domain-containing protein [Nocardia]
MDNDVATNDDPSRLAMLASAIAGRTLRVARSAPGEPAWTDGVTLFLDGAADPRRDLEALSVQASLLACGSLDPAIVRKLGRRPKSAARYLAVEAHRALLANEVLLPPSVLDIVDRELARSVDSPEASLSAAAGESPRDPPRCFGVIRPRRVVVAVESEQRSGSAAAHAPRRASSQELVDIPDESSDGDETDGFTSPIGGGGALGRLFQRMLGVARRTGGNGQPGADSATHRMRGGITGGGTVVSTATADSSDPGHDDVAAGVSYPEWDVHRGRYRPAWCTVHEVAATTESAESAFRSNGGQLRRPLSRLGLGLGRYHRQPQGDDLDLDAVVEARVEAIVGATPDESVYLDSLRRRRDLAVLVLLDISGSVAEAGSTGQTIHEQQRAVAGALAVALSELGDRVALYAFRSQGRAAVQLLPVKKFDERLDTTTMRRLSGLTPGSYSRLGAAIRHGTSILRTGGGTPRRLLVVLSDGLAYDHGYERAYGTADSRRALAEARREGIGAVCLTVGARTADDELRRVFGSAAHARIENPDRASGVIGPLFRSALRYTNARRRVARRPASTRAGAAATARIAYPAGRMT